MKKLTILFASIVVLFVACQTSTKEPESQLTQEVDLENHPGKRVNGY